MKTTPKPNATKKSKGELVGPPPPELVGDDVAAGGAVVVLDGSVVVGAELAIFAAVQTAGVVRFTAIGLGRCSNLCNTSGRLKCRPGSNWPTESSKSCDLA